jgi:DNA-binding winged helix-turn-helix (wHTH) protein
MLIQDETRMLVGPKRIVRLSKQSFAILRALMASPTKFVSHDALTELLWPGAQRQDKRKALDQAESLLIEKVLFAGFPEGEAFKIYGRGIAMRGAKVSVHKLTAVECHAAKIFHAKNGGVITHEEIADALCVSRPKVRSVIRSLRVKLKLPPTAIKHVYRTGYAIA